MVSAESSQSWSFLQSDHVISAQLHATCKEVQPKDFCMKFNWSQEQKRTFSLDIVAIRGATPSFLHRPTFSQFWSSANMNVFQRALKKWHCPQESKLTEEQWWAPKLYQRSSPNPHCLSDWADAKNNRTLSYSVSHPLTNPLHWWANQLPTGRWGAALCSPVNASSAPGFKQGGGPLKLPLAWLRHTQAISCAEWDSLIDFDTPRDLHGDWCLIQAHKQCGRFNLCSKQRA